MEQITRWVLQKLEPYAAHTECNTDALYYGINMAVYTIISTLSLFIIGAFAGYPMCTAVLVFTCYLNQTIGGGFHATSHLKCFLSMLSFLILGIFLITLNLSSPLLYAIALSAMAIMLHLPVVLHPNKSYLHKLIPKYAARSKRIIIFEFVLLLLLTTCNHEIFASFSIALGYSALSRIAAKVKYG